ncbi:MAG: metalloregulator ArsR/SmtB family transcription factor [Gemmatimonadota bacterium]
MTYGKALTALADPTRRSLFERLRRRPQAVGELTRWAGISQPAVSQHLRVLRDARLVAHRRDGTRHVYHATPDGLAELKAYLEAMWDDVLQAYQDSFEDPHRKTR